MTKTKTRIARVSTIQKVETGESNTKSVARMSVIFSTIQLIHSHFGAWTLSIAKAL